MIYLREMKTSREPQFVGQTGWMFAIRPLDGVHAIAFNDGHAEGNPHMVFLLKHGDVTVRGEDALKLFLSIFDGRYSARMFSPVLASDSGEVFSD